MVTVFELVAKRAVARAPSDRVAGVAVEEGHMEAAINMVRALGGNTDFIQEQRKALGSPTSLIVDETGMVWDL